MVMYGDGENGGSSVYERSGPRQVIISAESSLNPKLYPHTKKLIGTVRKPFFVRPLVLSAARVRENWFHRHPIASTTPV